MDHAKRPLVTFARALGLASVALLLWTFARRDLFTAGALGFAIVAIVMMVRRRSRRRALTVVATSTAAILMLALIASVLVPLWAGAVQPHLALRHLDAHLVPDQGRTGPEAIGLVLSEADGAAGAVADSAAYLTSIAPTSLRLGATPGTVTHRQVAPYLATARSEGASGSLVLANYDGTAFNGSRAAAVITDPVARARLVRTISSIVSTEGWDGVVIDFERISPTLRAAYPVFVRAVALGLRGKRTIVAIPASSDGTGEAAAFDLAALSRASSAILLMAYDQHDLKSTPGPVAGMPWVRASLDRALAAIPKGRLILGVPAYGYAWKKDGSALRDLTTDQGRELASKPGARAVFDGVEQEWHVTLPDGSQAWYSDPRSERARAALVVSKHLRGVAVWHVGAMGKEGLAALPFRPAKHRLIVNRAQEVVRARGLVALTFDDGPDPTWTPRILDILRREHVPATFFVIGRHAEAFPHLVRREAADGHLIGNHTWSHPDLATTSKVFADAEMVGTGALIETLTGKRPRLMRFPYGAETDSDGAGGGEQDAAGVAKRFGLDVIGWNDDSLDWTTPGTSAIVSRTEAGAREHTVVLMHDGGGDRSQTVAALPTVIRDLKARGYIFTTPDRMDALITAPYFERASLSAKARFWALASMLRLWMSATMLLKGIILLAAIVLISRLVWVVPAAFAEAGRARRRSREPYPVRVTVIVPAHNEARVIAKTLASLRALSWHDLEVIVVDDGSTDATAEVASASGFRVISQKRSGKAAALNTGIRAATGELVCILDADTLIRTDFLERATVHFARADVAAVAGNVKVGNRRNLLTRLQALEYIIGLSLDRRAQSAGNWITVVPGAAGVFRRSDVVAAGGYSSRTMVEDADLTITLLRNGGTIIYEPHAIVHTEAPETLREVMRQRRRWSFGTIQVVHAHAPAVLSKDAGRVGAVALPWLAIYQVILPLAGPIIDLWFLASLLVWRGRMGWAVFVGPWIALEVLFLAVAVLVDKEDWRLMLYAPAVHFIWRPIQLCATWQAAWRWVKDQPHKWHALKRTDSVPAPAYAAPLESLEALEPVVVGALALEEG